MSIKQILCGEKIFRCVAHCPEDYICFLTSHFPEVDACRVLCKKCEENIFQLQSISNEKICIKKRLLSIILVYLVCPQFLIWAMQKWKSGMQKVDSTLQIVFFVVDWYNLWHHYATIRLNGFDELQYVGATVGQGNIGSVAATGCWNSLQPFGHFACQWAHQWKETIPPILLHSLLFFPLNFASGYLALTGY